MPSWSGCRETSPHSCRIAGHGQGRARRDHAANLLQYPVALFGILRAGLTVVNVNPLYTPRELEHQLEDSGAKAIVIVENFASTLQQVLGNTHVEHVITTQIGDMLPRPKRWIVNLVIKRVKKMVPAWRIEGAISFRTALVRGAAMTLRPVEVMREDIAFLQYTGVPRDCERRDAHPPQHPCQRRADGHMDLGQLQGRLRDRNRAVPMYHIFCLTSTIAFMKWAV